MPGASSKAQSSHSQPVPATAARTGWVWWLWGHTGQVAHALWCSEPQGCSGVRVTDPCPTRSQCKGHEGFPGSWFCQVSPGGNCEQVQPPLHPTLPREALGSYLSPGGVHSAGTGCSEQAMDRVIAAAGLVPRYL